VEVALNRLLVVCLHLVAMVMPLVDANTCYDQAAHSIASIAVQHWVVEPVAMGVMLLTIQGSCSSCVQALVTHRPTLDVAGHHFRAYARAIREHWSCGYALAWL